MNRVAVHAEETPLPAWAPAVKVFVKKALRALSRDDWDVSVLFCGDPFIQKLNDKYRGINAPTDVLTFAAGDRVAEGGRERFIAGDIVISLESAAENARYFGVDEDEELRRLLVHGLLHLDGQDHVSNDLVAAAPSGEPMLLRQEEVLVLLKNDSILRAGAEARTKRKRI